jgi:hypothetical protein
MNRPWRTGAGAALALAWLGATSGCAHVGGAGAAGGRRATPAPAPDSITVALWHLDESTGTRLFDSGPYRLALSSGVDTRPDFGRVNGARRFQRSLDSFLYSAANPVLVPSSGFTCEMWINPTDLGQYELTPLAGCWNESPNQQSWMFALGGQSISAGRAYLPSPGFFSFAVPTPRPAQLVFIFQPRVAGGPRYFFSSATIALNRWTHVAVTFDDDVVRFWIDGIMDSQYASAGDIRPSQAPLLIGNYFDPTGLTGFTGTLRANVADPNPYYAYVGSMDEIRISSAARTDFPKRQ